VRHVAEGVLRRLDDEPLAVPDKVGDHVAACPRCRARRAQIAEDRARAARLLAAPALAFDTDAAWARFQRELDRSRHEGAARRRREPRHLRPLRFPRPSPRAGLVSGAIGIVLVGTAAAATLTNVFAPTHVAPLRVSQGDLRAITSFMGLEGSQALGGFPTPSGSRATRYGTITWSSSGRTHPVASLRQAGVQAGFAVPLPTHLPAGVGAIRQFIVAPRVTATVTFDARAARLAGSSVTLDAGPAVVAEYAATSTTELPTLGVVTMPRPRARSAGASLSQIEAFVLSQPGISPGLAQEFRLLGDPGTTLPVPVPAGASVRSVRVAGRAGVLVADPSNAAAGVVWQDGAGTLHIVAGILDSQDVLNVAGQLG
jgi:hypothetical protein